MASRQELQDDAVAKLKKFIPGISKRDYINYILAGGIAGAANTNDSPKGLEGIEKALDPIVNLVNGGKFLDEILAELEAAMVGSTAEANTAISRFVRVTPSKVLLDGTYKNSTKLASYGILNGAASFSPPNDTDKRTFSVKDRIPTPVGPPSKTNTSLVAIEMLNPKIGIMVRDTSALQVFCSMIPAYAISRAVPYITAKIYTPYITSTSTEGTKVESLNLIRYLKGNVAYNKNDTLSAMILSLTGSGNVASATPGGMELFTAPQTMVYDPTDTTNKFGSYKPIDRFRPLMTLNDVSFEVVSAGAGMMSYKNASMNITLHDRGRLAEIVSLVKPGMYSSTEIELEYGWSADPRSGNAEASDAGELTNFATQDDVFTQFVDSLRVKEKYQVVNSTFKFDDAGQVNVSITLAMKGASDLKSYDISDDSLKKKARDIKEIVEKIQTLLAKNGEQAQTLFGETLLDAVSSPNSVLALDDEDLVKVKAAVSKLAGQSAKKGGDYTTLNESMSVLFAGTGSKSVDFQAAAKNSVDTILKEILKEAEIFPASKNILQNKEFSAAEKKLLVGAKPYNQISLGKVLLAFVGIPLAKSGQFDEIQFIFNKINNRAGFVRGLSIAAFPLDSDLLAATLTQLYSKNLSVSLSTFIGTLGQAQVNNIAHKAYGSSGSYKTDKESGEIEILDDQQDEIDTQLAAAGIYDLNFQLPSLQVMPECVPHANDATKTILRIHVMDGACTPHQTYAEAINSARTDSSFFVDSYALSSDNKLFPSAGGVYSKDMDPAVVGSERVADINKMIDVGVLKAVIVTSSTEVKQEDQTVAAAYKLDLSRLFSSGDPKLAKKFLSEALPTMRYGTSAGMIKSISLSSISDPALATINTIKMDDAAGDNPGNVREKGLPLTISPTEVSVDMLGCPIINFGQSVYIDFGTNTTADNIYACTGLSHKFAPGEFSTSAKFTLNIGAYGIYNSSKRSFDITKAMVESAAGGGALGSRYSEEIKKGAKNYIWGTDCFTGVVVKDFITDLEKNKSIGAIWSFKDEKTTFVFDEAAIETAKNAIIAGSDIRLIFIQAIKSVSPSPLAATEWQWVDSEISEKGAYINMDAFNKEGEPLFAAKSKADQIAAKTKRDKKKNEKDKEIQRLADEYSKTYKAWSAAGSPPDNNAPTRAAFLKADAALTAARHS